MKLSRLLMATVLAIGAMACAQDHKFEYRLLATTKTSTMEKEMN